MIRATPLDEALNAHGLSMGSFDGLSVDAAVRLMRLDERSIQHLGYAHRERCLSVRDALIDRLSESGMNVREYLFGGVLLAEQRLDQIRNSYRAAALKEGVTTAAIFGDCAFVKRSSAEAWVREAREEGREEERARLLAAKKADNDNPGDPGEEPGDEGDNSPHTPPEDSGTAKKRRKEAEKNRKEAAGEDDEAAKAARFFAPRAADSEYWDWVKTGAAAITRAAAKRRGAPPPPPDWERLGNHPKPDLRVIPGAPPPPKGSMARQIIDAGRKARNLPPIEED